MRPCQFLAILILSALAAAQCGCSPESWCVVVRCEQLQSSRAPEALALLYGNLVLDHTGHKAFPHLRAVTQSVVTEVYNRRSLSASFPRLVRIDSNLLIVDTFKLRHLEFPLLELVGGRVEVYLNEALPTLLLPRLHSVGLSFEMRENPRLRIVDVPELSVVGRSLTVDTNNALHCFSLPKLHSIGGLFIGANAELLQFSVPSLIHLSEENPEHAEIWVFSNPKLSTFCALCPLARRHPHATFAPAEELLSINPWSQFAQWCRDRNTTALGCEPVGEDALSADAVDEQVARAAGQTGSQRSIAGYLSRLARMFLSSCKLY